MDPWRLSVPRACSLLRAVTDADDEPIRRLVLARLVALGRLAPGGGPVLASLGATAIGVIDGVHGDRAHRRPGAAPAGSPGLAGDLVHVVRVGDRSHRRHALLAHASGLAGIEAQDRPAGVATDELRIGPCGTGNLAAAARLEFDIVHNGTDRHGGQLHGVAGLHVGLDAGDHRVARRQALRRQYVVKRSVAVLQERDECRAVGIVLEPLDPRGHVMLAAPKVDQAVGLLVAAADMAHGDAAVVIAAARPGLALGQPLDGPALPQVAAVHLHQLAQAGGGRTEGLQCHRRLPVTARSSRRSNGPLRGSRWRAWYRSEALEYS